MLLLSPLFSTLLLLLVTYEGCFKSSGSFVTIIIYAPFGVHEQEITEQKYLNYYIKLNLVVLETINTMHTYLRPSLPIFLSACLSVRTSVRLYGERERGSDRSCHRT